MCTIYLMRHGHTPMDTLKRSDGWLDLPLSDKGRIGLIGPQQYLKLEKIKNIYAAPLRRTLETAHIMQSGVMSAPDVVSAKQAITWDLGALAGTPKRYSHPKVERYMHKQNERPKGGESYAEFKKRFVPWFHARVEEAKESSKPVLIIGSGTNLRLVGQILFGSPESINVDEGGLVALKQVAGKWTHEIIFGGKDASEHMS